MPKERVRRATDCPERPVRVEVLVASMSRHDGSYVRPGDKLLLTPEQAKELIVRHFVRVFDGTNFVRMRGRRRR